MDHVEIDELPPLTRPALVCAFGGWNDGGEAATTAARYLRDRWGGTLVGRLDPEEFFDFQVTRPTVSLVEGVSRRIDWPANDIYRSALPSRDVLLLIGLEPNVRWKTFVGAILDAARRLDVQILVTLGAFLADVPHTFPSAVAASALEPEQAARLGVSPSRYEGPTGIVGVLHDAATRAGLSSLSLWAAVPHYLPAGPNPKAALALVEKVTAVLEVDVDTDTLVRAGRTWERQVSAMIEDNAELGAYVRRLEESAGEREELDIPSGDTLAAELERFLREERGKD